MKTVVPYNVNYLIVVTYYRPKATAVTDIRKYRTTVRRLLIGGIMDLGLKDKVALITGAAQGIGKAISMKLAQNGVNIAVCDIDENLAGQTAEELKKIGSQAEAYRLDVSQITSVEEVLKKILDKFSRIDILVNNAGITRDNLIIRMKDEEWDSVLGVNLKGVFNCTRAVSRVMMKQRYGRIVNIASVVGIMGNAGQANYSASKGGVIALTKTCAKELASRNINVNAVAPGFIQTKMTDILSEEIKNNLMKLIPLSKLGQAEDVASAVLFLVSELAGYVTGEVIKVDGGMAM